MNRTVNHQQATSGKFASFEPPYAMGEKPLDQSDMVLNKMHSEHETESFERQLPKVSPSLSTKLGADSALIQGGGGVSIKRIPGR